MDLVKLYDDEDCSEDTSADHLLSPDSPDTNDIYGDPPVLPRVGVEYQVEVPPLELEHLQAVQNLIDADAMADLDYFVRIGSAIPVTWILNRVDDVKHELLESPGTPVDAEMAGSIDSINRGGNQINSKSSTLSECETEMPNNHGTILDHESDHDRGARSTSHGGAAVDSLMNIGLPLVQQRKSKYIAMPGSQIAYWNSAETDSFLLGLYIFGKNLVQMRKFLEGKEMGDILSFYYGRFYRSDVHRRWSECRKIRSRRCIHGQRIFTGWRQQELLSRLFPSLSEASQNTLREATKALNEGRSSLEEYVFALKSIVNMKALVEAVGIGKGKHDLTGIVSDPARTNQVISIRSEIPVGKACSSLTSSDIIKFLTGDFRLSKARSNDLFWEAVWPRLLAKGWHSEQPENHGYVSSKHALVFLVPGIKKFSRRKLVKGNHYFDSVSDVLNKVASDPWLLELEVEGPKGSSSIKDECGWDVNNGEQNGASDHQRYCYLRPRLPNCNSELMKFTVVDTSLVQGEAPFKVSELRNLPVDNACSYGPSRVSGETESDSSGEQKNSANTLFNEQAILSDDKKLGNNMKNIIDKGMGSDLSNHAVTVPKGRMPTNNHNSDGPYLDLLNNGYPVKKMKCQFGHRVKSVKPNYLSPDSKRRRLSACNYSETGCRSYAFSRGHRSKKERISCQSKSLEASDAVAANVGLCQGKTSTSYKAKGSPIESCEYFDSGNHFGASIVNETSLYRETAQPRSLIDLNLPQFPVDFESIKAFSAEVADSHNDSSLKLTSLPSESKQNPEDSEGQGISNGMPNGQQQTVNARRQSTRNRPLTTRALEALASGFLTTRRKRRGTKVPLSGNVASGSSQPACKTDKASVSITTMDHGNAISDFTYTKFEAMDEECISNTDHATVFRKYHVQSERKGTTDQMLGLP